MIVGDLQQLAAIYDVPPVSAAVVKEVARLTPEYRALIAASPFAVLATCGPEGLDCSPRGDQPGFVRIVDDRTLLMPDRRGNNRIDSLRNIVSDPRIALLFLIPGSGTTFRVNGTAVISAAPDLLASFAVQGKSPRTVMIVSIETAYFQCARAIVRSQLWNPERHGEPADLPSPGAMLAALTHGREGGPEYDHAWLAKADRTLW